MGRRSPNLGLGAARVQAAGEKRMRLSLPVKIEDSSSSCVAQEENLNNGSPVLSSDMEMYGSSEEEFNISEESKYAFVERLSFIVVFQSNYSVYL